MAFDAGNSTPWLRVDVDHDGVMVVRDLVDGHVSEPIETVGCSPASYAEKLHEAIVEVMRMSGLAL